MSLRGSRGAARGGRLSTSSPRGGGAAPRGWSTPNGYRGAQPPNANANANISVAPPPSASAFPSLASQQLQTPGSASSASSARSLFVLTSLVGNTVVVSTRTGQRFVGILHSTSQGDTGVTLSSAQEIKADGTLAAPTKLLVIKGEDVDVIDAPDVTLGEPVRARSNAFRTDNEISSANRPDPAARTLEKWDDDGGLGGIEDGPAPPASSRPSSRGWDQFAANEAQFGLKTNYDEDMYTTKLDRTGKDFKEKERRAEKLAAEIMGETTQNTHLAEERGHVDDSGQNEEDKYGAVVRGPNAYVPPAARRAAAAANASAAATPRVVVAGSAGNNSNKAATPTPSIAVNVPSPTMTDSGVGAGAGAGAAKPDGSMSVSASTSPAAAASSTMGANADPSKSSTRLHNDFKQFVSSERQRFESRKQQQTEQEKRAKLEELKKWSTSFKLNTPMPNDVPLASQKAKSPSPTPAPSAAAATSPPAQLAETKAMLAKMTIPKIPPFKAKQPSAAPAPAAAAPAAPAAAAASSAAPSKMSAKASSFKPFNPAAASFTPGATPTVPVTPATPPANPFFGARQIKKSPTPLHVREDFTPFRKHSAKHAPQVPESSSIPPTWPYTGKSFRAMYSQAASSTPSAGPAGVPGSAAPSDVPTPGTPQQFAAPAPALIYQQQQQQQQQQQPPGPFRFPPQGGQYPMPLPHGVPQGVPHGLPHGVPHGVPHGAPFSAAMMGPPHHAHAHPHAHAHAHGIPFSPSMPPQGGPMYSPQMAAAAVAAAQAQAQAQAAAGVAAPGGAPAQFAGVPPPGTPRTPNAKGAVAAMQQGVPQQQQQVQQQQPGGTLPPQMYYQAGGAVAGGPPLPGHFVPGQQMAMRPMHGGHGHPHHLPHHPQQQQQQQQAHLPLPPHQQVAPPTPHSMGGGSDASSSPAVGGKE